MVSAKQKYDCIVIVDFEATCWDEKDPKKDLSKQEIIEFAAVILDTKAFTMGKFTRFCKPRLVPNLTKFCTDLTTITQQDVNNSEYFPEVYKKFLDWLVLNKLLEKDTYKQTEYKFALLTVGNWDFLTMFPKQCKHCNIIPKKIFSEWINIKVIFQKTHNINPGGLKNMLRILKLKFEGTPHRGICDCVNTAYVLKSLIQDGVYIENTGRLR